MSEITFTEDELAAEETPEQFNLTDREMLMEIHVFMSNINDMLVHVGPALDGISRSPMGKMLGIK